MKGKPCRLEGSVGHRLGSRLLLPRLLCAAASRGKHGSGHSYADEPPPPAVTLALLGSWVSSWSQSVHALGEKCPPLLCRLHVSVFLSTFWRGKEKNPNLCLDGECIGATSQSRKHERWEGRFHISIAHNASTRLLPSPALLLLHPFHYS